MSSLVLSLVQSILGNISHHFASEGLIVLPIREVDRMSEGPELPSRQLHCVTFKRALL